MKLANCVVLRSREFTVFQSAHRIVKSASASASAAAAAAAAGLVRIGGRRIRRNRQRGKQLYGRREAARAARSSISAACVRAPLTKLYVGVTVLL